MNRNPPQTPCPRGEKARFHIQQNGSEETSPVLKGGWGGFALLLTLTTTSAFAADQNDSWRGSVRTKLQTDNRYDMKEGDVTGEAWGTLVYNNPNQQLNAQFSAVSRLSSDIYDNRQQLYQAFAEKTFEVLPVMLRAGRFEKSDHLGLYLVDGAAVKYQVSNPLSIEMYGGRPLQVDHVQSLRGRLVAGVESAWNVSPHFSTRWFTLEKTDFRCGFQTVQRDEILLQDTAPSMQVVTQQPKDDNASTDMTKPTANPEEVLLDPFVNDNFDVIETSPALEATTVENPLPPPTNANFDVLGIPTQTLRKRTLTTYRYNAATHLTGDLLGEKKPFEIYLKGTYASEKSRLENMFVDAWWDVFKNVRLRNYFEAYRPIQPYVTFRDRFYSAYALGEQEIWRGSVEHRFTRDLRYSLGFQMANRQIGYEGKGANASLSYQFSPSIVTQGTVDYLELNSGEYATSFYGSLSHAVDSQNRYMINFALRDEQKSLYGKNFAAGAEMQWQTMIKNNWVLEFKGSYIHNSALPNEYLGAVQLTYYFDYFQAKRS